MLPNREESLSQEEITELQKLMSEDGAFVVERI
jgi:hypothetical protein